MTMTPMIETFVMHFGEMGSRWGFNRTVGQMYALLVISEEALSANDIADARKVSASAKARPMALNIWATQPPTLNPVASTKASLPVSLLLASSRTSRETKVGRYER